MDNLDTIGLYLKGYRLTVLQVIYFLPDYPSLLQEFIWETLDVPPKFWSIHRFLDYWKNNIEAPINEIKIDWHENSNITKFQTVDKIYKC